MAANCRVNVQTVGDLKAALAEIPDNTPIGRMTQGYYRTIKTGARLYHGPIGSRRSEAETKLDMVPDGTVVVQFEPLS